MDSCLWAFLLLPGWGSVQGSIWRWPARLRRLARRLECGQSLGEALSIDPKLVPSAYRVSSKAALGEIALVGFWTEPRRYRQDFVARDFSPACLPAFNRHCGNPADLSRHLPRPQNATHFPRF